MSVEESSQQYDSKEDEEDSKTKKNRKKSKKKKKKFSSEEDNSNESNEEESKEDESEENEEDEEEESGEDDEGYKKRKKKGKKKKNKKKKREKSEKEEKTEEKEEIEKEEKIKTKDDYIAQIEQLENELLLEKKISDSLGENPENNEELLKLQINLSEKTEKLDQLITTNHRQEEALSVLRRQLDKEQDKYKSRNKPKILLTQNFSNPIINNNIGKNRKIFLSQNDESKKEAINIVLKIKEKVINVAINKMNMYKKENELLKKELYKNDDYTNKLGLEDNTNENKKKLMKLDEELKILNNQLEEHQKCLYERNLLNKEYLELKQNLKELKQSIKETKDSLKIKQKELDLNNIANFDTVEDATTNNYLSPRSNATKTIASPNSNKISRNNLPHLNLTKSYKILNSNLLPAILSPTSNKYDKNILSDEFYSKLKKHYEGRDHEYEILLEKIKETENSRNFIENKHKNEIKQFNTQILSLDEQFKILNNDGKGNGSNIRVLKYKLNITKNEAKHCLSQLQKLKSKLDFAKNISKERDHEIFLLKGQINLIKNKKIKKKKELDKDSIDSTESEKEKKIKKAERKSINKENIKNKNDKNIKANNSINKDSIDKNLKKNDIIKNNDIKNDSNINNNINDKAQNMKKIINIKKSLTNSKIKKLNLNLKEKKK